MRQEPTDVSLDAFLRTLELYYAYHAASSFEQTKFLNRLDCRMRPESLPPGPNTVSV
jgi:hypothetical protein